MSPRPNTLGVKPHAPAGEYERIAVEDLLFDVKNPRLAEFGLTENANQFQILQTLWKYMAIQEIAMSIAHNGYFNHEPIFVEKLGSKFVVIEGNRRLAAVNLLLDSELRDRLRANDLPPITPERRREIAALPAILTTREAAWRYLGFKHVNGPSTWGSYAKAQYIAFVRNTYGVPLEDIAAQIGDYNSTIERMYRGLMIIEQAEHAKIFDRTDVAKSKFHFNYMYTGMDYPGVKSFLGLERRSTTPERKPVPPSKLKHLGELLVWLYGSKKLNKTSLIRSQNPDLKTLDGVLQSEKGIKALRDGLPLTVAEDISIGDEKLFSKSIQQAKIALQKALGTVTTGFLTDDSESLTLASDIESLARDLSDAMMQKRTRSNREQRHVKRGNA